MATYLEAPEDDAISLTLAKYKPQELLDVVKGLKQIIDSNPGQARALLEANSDLTYAILQAGLTMGLVDDLVVNDAMEAARIGSSQTNVQGTAETSQAAPEPAPQSQAAPAARAPSPAACTNAAKTTQPAAPAQPKDPFSGMDPQQAEMIKQVLLIPDEQIQLLPSDQREQVLNLKRTYGSSAFGH